MSSQLLTGVRVLDLTNVLAGPFADYQLALLGADAALNRRGMGTSFLAQNAGKRSLNLKSEDGKVIFRRLVANADVVLEYFRSGVMDRLGLGYEAHRELTMTLLIDDPERDSITVTRSGFQVGGAPQSVAHGPPTLGQHNDEILLEAGFTMNEIAAWRANGTIEAQRHARAA